MKKNKENIYLGVWFQRTSLHLKEFLDFLNGKDNINGLDTKKIKELRRNLDLKNIEFKIKNDFNVLTAESDTINFSMSEDGTILVHSELEDFKTAAKKLEAFYSRRLSPALSYLFSRGAPLPKDLGEIKEVYPLYIVSYDLSDKETNNIFKFLNDSPFSIDKKPNFKISTGKELEIINIIKAQNQLNKEAIENLVRYVVLFREFEKQLSQYLNIHRNIWESISAIRESNNLTMEKFPKVRSKVLDYLKTLSFVRARLCQMKDILISREEILSVDGLKLLDSLDFKNRFKILSAEQAYVLNLWDMTIEYAKGTLDLLDSLLAEGTQKEIGLLQMISFMGIATGFFGMNVAFPLNKMSYIVFGTILLFAIFIRFILKFNIRKKRIKMK